MDGFVLRVRQSQDLNSAVLLATNSKDEMILTKVAAVKWRFAMWRNLGEKGWGSHRDVKI